MEILTRISMLFAKKKILVEKPFLISSSDFIKFKNIKNNIFVGYNRIYYNNIKILEKKIKGSKNLLIKISAPEKKIENIITNSCHLFSILFFLFKNIKLVNITRNRNHIVCELDSREGNIFLFFCINSPENTEITINNKNNIYKLSPLERLTIYNKMKIIKKNNLNFYNPSVLKIYEEKLNFKPGFVDQYKNFKKFIKNKRCKFLPYYQCKKIVELCNKIVSSKN